MNTKPAEETLTALSQQVVMSLQKQGLRLTTVESCTGGALANAITDTVGSGDTFKEGFVAYSNQAKLALGVPQETLDTFSVYSVQTAEAMARAGMRASMTNPDIGIGITGSLSRADPDNTHDSVVGEVYVAIVSNNKTTLLKLDVPQSLPRAAAKRYVATHVLTKLLDAIGTKSTV